MSTRPVRRPLVGRRAELATAERLVRAARRGDGGALLVTGEAGIGKSRLVVEVGDRAAAAGLVVLSGRATPGGGAFRPLTEALARPLREHGPGAPRLRPHRAALARLVPGWSGSGDADGRGGPTPDPAVVLGEAVLALLRELGGDRGCALLLEDLHWADTDTLDLLAYLTDALAGTPVLLVLSARDDAVPAAAATALAVIAARPGATALPLPRLDAAAVRALAAARRGGVPVPEPELERLVQLGDGLPLLVEELLDAGPSAGAVPPTLAALVAGRLAALPAPARPVLVAAAVVPGDPDWRLLAAATGVGGPRTVEALRAAVDAGLLDRGPDGPLRWRHALTREAVLAAVLPPERAVVALHAARVLDGRDDPDDRAAAAELYLSAGEAERGTVLLLELARRDAARGALRSAEALLTRAAGTGRLAAEVAAERVRVLTHLGRAADALAAGEAVLAGGTVVGDAHAELCLRLARAAVTGGRWAEAERWIERAGRPDGARSLVLAADAAYGAGDVARAVGLARAAVRAAEALPGPEGARALCEALTVLARGTLGPDPREPAAAFGRAAQVAAEHGLTPWRVEALFGRGALEWTTGDTSGATLRLVRDLAEESGMLAQVVQADVLLADLRLQVDGPRAGAAPARRAAERAGRLRLTGLQGIAEVQAAAAAALAGDARTAAALLTDAATRADAPAEVAALAPVVRGCSRLVENDLAGAAGLVDDGVVRLLAHRAAPPLAHFGLWALLRTAADDRGDRAAAARGTARHHHSFCAVANRGAVTYAEAVAAGRGGRAGEAAERFAAADAATAALPWWNRLLRSVALGCAVADGWGDPVPALRADLAAHEQAGDQGLARTCRDLLRAAGAPTRRSRGSAPVPPALRRLGITGRETEVLALVSGGLTNVQVAERLFLSPRTVETHVARLLAKTGATGRAELRTWAGALSP